MINNFNRNYLSLLAILILIVASSALIFYFKPNLRDKVSKRAPASTSSAQPQEEVAKVSGVEETEIPAEVAKKVEKVKNLTTTLLQLAKETGLITQESASESKSVQGVATSADKQSQINKLKEIATQRKKIMLEILDVSPKTFINQSLPANIRSTLPGEVQKLIEVESEVSGKLSALHIDNPDESKSKTSYFLGDPKSNLPLLESKIIHFIKLPSDINLETRPLLKIRGILLDEHVAVFEDGVSKIEDKSKVKGVSTNQKVAVLLVNFTDDTRTPFTKEQVNSIVFGDGRSVKTFYKEGSFGQVNFTGEVFGWFTLDTTLHCDFGEIMLKGNRLATENGISLSDYGYVTFVIPPERCPFAGLGFIGYGYNLINGSMDLYVFAHELGHNIGLHHASQLRCGAKSVDRYSSCSTSEYGDHSDVMGGLGFTGYLLVHFNGPHKLQAGFLPRTRAIHVTQDGDYTISSLEKNTDSPQVMVINKTDTLSTRGDKYYLSYRQPLGYDRDLPSSFTEGASVHIFNGSPIQTLLVDTVSGDGDLDGGLKDNSSFIDEINGINVKQVSHGSDSVVLSVKFGAAQCTKQPPTLEARPNALPVSPGKTVDSVIRVTNNNTSTCPATTFNFRSSLLPGWSQSADPSTLTLQPGASGTSTYSVTSAQNASYGQHNFALNVADANDPDHKNTANLSYYVFETRAAISGFYPRFGYTDSVVSIFGTDFGSTKGSVFFGSTPGNPGSGVAGDEISRWGNSRITVKVPSGARSGRIGVTTSTGTSAVSNFDFDVLPKPTITDFNPKSGPPGTTVTISGSNFGSARGSVFLERPNTNLVLSTDIISWSNNAVSISIPVGAESGNLSVSTAAEATVSTNTPFTVTINPTISQIDPSSAAAGQSVAILGNNFGFVKGLVKIESGLGSSKKSVGLIVNNWSNESISAVIPKEAVSGKIVVQTVAGRSGESQRELIILPSPAITTFDPSSAGGGSAVAISGNNFGSRKGEVYLGSLKVEPTGTISAGGIPVKVESWNASNIIVTIPNNAPNAKFVIKTADNRFGESATEFKFTSGPGGSGLTISAFTPTSGKTDDFVAIVGSNFGATRGQVYFGTTRTDGVAEGNAAFIAAWSNNNLSVRVPAGAKTGKILVITTDTGFKFAYSNSDFNFSTTPGSSSTTGDTTGGKTSTKTTAEGHEINGSDGTWCDDSNKNSPYTKGSCTDKNGTFTNYCDGSVFRDYYCSGTWNGKSWASAHCQAGGLGCPSDKVCSVDGCVASSGTSSPSPSSSSSPSPSTSSSPSPSTSPSPSPSPSASPAHQKNGADGTWCDDSSSGYIPGSCTDNTGTFTNNCSGGIFYDYYCSGPWNGSVYLTMKCERGGYNNGCVQGAATYNHPPQITTTSLESGSWLRSYRGLISVVDNDGEKLEVKITGLPWFLRSNCSQSGSMVNCSLSGWPIFKGTSQIVVKVTDSAGSSDIKTIPLTIR